MKASFGNNHRFDPIHNWHQSFLSYESDWFTRDASSQNVALWIGNGFWSVKKGKHLFDQEPNKEKFNILIDFESRNNHAAWEDKFDRILTLDADVAKWRNDLLGQKKYIYVYFPTSDYFFDDPWGPLDKKYDIAICGTPEGKYLTKHMFAPIVSYSHIWVGNGQYPPGLKRARILDCYTEKMRLVSESRITVCWNAVSFTTDTIEQVFNDHSLLNNPRFREIAPLSFQHPDFNVQFIADNKDYRKPQLKTRAFEAAAGKSLILTCFDEFRHIEEWFIEGEDFVYFQPGELRNKIKDILDNFDSYESIIENAHQKAKKLYKTSNFWQDFIEKEYYEQCDEV